MSKRAVVFGSSGQLGVELVCELKARGYEVHGFERKAIDITDRELVEQSLSRLDPEIVFNAAAYNQVDVAEREPQAAFLANALGVRNLAMACRQMDARFVHFSTDYVFDGSAGRPYTEEDPTHPWGPTPFRNSPASCMRKPIWKLRSSSAPRASSGPAASKPPAEISSS